LTKPTFTPKQIELSHFKKYKKKKKKKKKNSKNKNKLILQKR